MAIKLGEFGNLDTTQFYGIMVKLCYNHWKEMQRIADSLETIAASVDFDRGDPAEFKIPVPLKDFEDD